MTCSEAELSVLLELLYESAADQTRWPDFLYKLANITKATAAVLVVHDTECQHHSINMSVGVDPASTALYRQYFGERDEWWRRGQSVIRPGWVGTGDMLCPRPILHASEFYNDFLKRFDVSQICGAGLDVRAGYSANISITRSHRQSDFEEHEVALLRFLVPHLQRAVKLQDKIALLNAKIQIAECTIESTGVGTIFTALSGRVLLTNPMADSILKAGDGLVCRKSMLSAQVGRESRELCGLLHAACQTGAGKGLHPGGAMLISRVHSPHPLQILISPFHSSNVLIEMRPTAVLFVIDPDRNPLPNEELLRTLFNLTPAEVRICIRLLEGKSLNEAADSTAISINTAKTHLKSIFSKTGIARQSQLIALLVRLLPHKIS
jgi:DNA-binding CsgD family transcriptional regulator